MTQRRPHNYGIWAYLKNTIRQKSARKKVTLVSTALFILLLLSSYFWESTAPSLSKNKTLLIKGSEYQCTLARIIDGDTITAHCPVRNPQTINVRIWGIDAPETKQIPWGEKAAHQLNNILRTNKHDIITIKIMDIDQYNRYVGQIFINHKEVDVGLQMVREGYAVVYQQYNKDSQYLSQEKAARNAKKGIWQTAGSQQNPASWRKVNPF